MKITLFGATGETGKCLIDQALKRGLEVVVFARSGSPFDHLQVRVVRGDLLDTHLLASAIRGSSAVLSALGPTSPKHPNDLPITRATQAIVSVMKEEGVKRFIAISTGTARDPDDGFDPKISLPAWLIRLMMPATYRDIIALAKAVRTSELDWTMVRVPFLKNRPAARSLNVGLYGKTKHSFTAAREDVAAFMLDQIASREFIRKAPGISSR